VAGERQPAEGTDGYPTGTEGYRSDGKDVSPAEQAVLSGAQWWAKAGYGSLQEYIDEHERRWEAWGNGGRPPPMPEPKPPGGKVPRRRQTPSSYSRQVNVKLRPEIYTGLSELATGYGVAASTMARMLVNQGVLLARDARGAPGPADEQDGG
jgi:hypothetical protein